MSGPLNSSKPTTSVIVGGVYNATTPAPANKQALALQQDNEGNLLVNVAVGGGGGGGAVDISGHAGGILDAVAGAAAPANVLQVGGSDGTDIHALNSDASGNIGVNLENTPTVVIGSATPAGFHIANNTVQAIKASAGVLRGYFLDNTANSATTYFQFFNIASGSVSLGSSSPLFVIPVPAGLAANLAMSGGWTFSTAMSFAATTTYNGSTAPGSAVDCTIAYV